MDLKLALAIGVLVVVPLLLFGLLMFMDIHSGGGGTSSFGSSSGASSSGGGDSGIGFNTELHPTMNMGGVGIDMVDGSLGVNVGGITIDFD